MALGTDRRGLLRTGIAGTAVLLAAALFVIVNYFGWKYHQRFDWTESNLYTLSPKTESVLAALESDVDVYVFLDPQDQLFEPTRELLARYEAASPRLSIRMVDPAKNLMETQRLVERFDLDRAAVVFASGDEKRVVPRNDLAELDFSTLQFGGQEPEVQAFRGEQRFTRALIDLGEAEPPRVLFTVGHGELRLDERGQRGLGELQRVLGTDNFQIDEWASLGEEAVPADADLVVIAGPSSSFLPPELAMLDAYLEGGGALLVLLDSPLEGGGAGGGGAAEEAASGAGPETADDSADGAGGGAAALAEWLAGYGMEVGGDTVVDPEGTLPFYGAGTFFVSRYPSQHAVTAPLAGDELPVLMSLARSVSPGEAPPGLTVETLLASSADAWGETDPSELVRGPGDTPGPVSLGVAVEREGARDEGVEELDVEDLGAEDPAGEDFLAEAGEGPGEAGGGDGMRLVVYGDSGFVTDQFLGNFGNAALVSSTVNWLTERQALVAIPPRTPESSRLEITGSELRGLYLLSLVLLPGLCLAAGVLVWYRRRR
ncbi:MAG TPA: GldG family protein [Thermoanaerobaculia bacterium]|nr:GldG family protein [Thermoanaerobaculia bacterium]